MAGSQVETSYVKAAAYRSHHVAAAMAAAWAAPAHMAYGEDSWWS